MQRNFGKERRRRLLRCKLDPVVSARLVAWMCCPVGGGAAAPTACMRAECKLQNRLHRRDKVQLLVFNFCQQKAMIYVLGTLCDHGHGSTHFPNFVSFQSFSAGSFEGSMTRTPTPAAAATRLNFKSVINLMFISNI